MALLCSRALFPGRKDPVTTTIEGLQYPGAKTIVDQSATFPKKKVTPVSQRKIRLNSAPD